MRLGYLRCLRDRCISSPLTSVKKVAQELWRRLARHYADALLSSASPLILHHPMEEEGGPAAPAAPALPLHDDDEIDESDFEFMMSVVHGDEDGHGDGEDEAAHRRALAAAAQKSAHPDLPTTSTANPLLSASKHEFWLKVSRDEGDYDEIEDDNAPVAAAALEEGRKGSPECPTTPRTPGGPVPGSPLSLSAVLREIAPSAPTGDDAGTGGAGLGVRKRSIEFGTAAGATEPTGKRQRIS
jgi:hypothetical protein